MTKTSTEDKPSRAVALVLAMVPAGSPLRGDGGSIVDSPLMDNIAVFLMLFLMVIGTVSC
ncbi:AbgT family transporter [Saccharopolyspora sp. K220]|uniref:AbgT family transporter n=1 Tax=Saccharopolyspora soli TaxID=2926618 RepID=UPI001F59E121|nr:AbgT family transporter [Saccharopolyspora soli]MCI2421941.1 AbgT family transporter [Saccharopolyspora soli]